MHGMMLKEGKAIIASSPRARPLPNCKPHARDVYPGSCDCWWAALPITDRTRPSATRAAEPLAPCIAAVQLPLARC